MFQALGEKVEGRQHWNNFKNTERGGPVAWKSLRNVELTATPSPTPYTSACLASLGGISYLCAPSHVFSSAQPPLPAALHSGKQGPCCLALAADLILTSADVLHCHAISALLPHASTFFCCPHTLCSFVPEVVSSFYRTSAKSMPFACHCTAHGLCCILSSLSLWPTKTACIIC